jgi:outer membrane lipoprotein SlyB
MTRPAVLLAALLALSACAPAIRAGTVPQASVGAVSTVIYGTVLEARPVKIDGRVNGPGGAIGSVAGGIAGAQIGGGALENAAASIAGALVGGALGQAIERDATATTGFAYTIQLDDGQVIQIVEATKTAYPARSRVAVIWGQGEARVQQSAAR